jgi:hypothetical protein
MSWNRLCQHCCVTREAGNRRIAIDYRCEDGRFPLSVSCVTISNLDLLSSSETGVNHGMISWKSTDLSELWCRKAIGGIYSRKMWRGDTTNCIKIWQYQTSSSKLYLQMHLLAKRFLFRGWW